MKQLVKVVICILFPALVFAQDNVADEKVLIKLNDDFIRNFVNNDTSSHNTIIHPVKFLLINADGVLVGRKEYMDNWSHGYDKKVMPEFEYRDTKVRLFGDMAIVIAKTHYRMQRDGKWGTGETRYADTYIKENGRWWCVQAHLTRIPFVFD
jgi:ketosteroid isomerase-like protein